MADIQRLRFREPLPIAEHEKQVNQSVEANEAPSVERLDGEVMKLQEVDVGGGVYCKVWEGRWETINRRKDGGEGICGEKMGDKGTSREKVSLSLTVSILLIRFFVGGLESTPSTRVTREGAQGSTLAGCLYAVCSCVPPWSLETRT